MPSMLQALSPDSRRHKITRDRVPPWPLDSRQKALARWASSASRRRRFRPPSTSRNEALQRAILAHPAKASGNKKRRKLITEGQSRHLFTYPGSSSRHQALVQQRIRRNTYRKVTRLRQAKSTPSRLQVVIAGSPRRSLLFIPQKCKRCKNNHGRRSSSRSTVGFWAPSNINPALIPPLLGPTFPTRPSTPQRRATPGMAPYVPMYSLYSSGRRIPQHVRSEGDHHRVVFQKEKSPLPNFLASFVPREEPAQASFWSRAPPEGAHRPAPDPPPSVLHG